MYVQCYDCIGVDWVGQDAQSGLFVGVNRTDRRGQSVAASGSRKSDGSSRVKEINLCLLPHKIVCVSWLRSYLRKSSREAFFV